MTWSSTATRGRTGPRRPLGEPGGFGSLALSIPLGFRTGRPFSPLSRAISSRWAATVCSSAATLPSSSTTRAFSSVGESASRSPGEAILPGNQRSTGQESEKRAATSFAAGTEGTCNPLESLSPLLDFTFKNRTLQQSRTNSLSARVLDRGDPGYFVPRISEPSPTTGRTSFPRCPTDHAGVPFPAHGSPPPRTAAGDRPGSRLPENRNAHSRPLTARPRGGAVAHEAQQARPSPQPPSPPRVAALGG